MEKQIFGDFWNRSASIRAPISGPGVQIDPELAMLRSWCQWGEGVDRGIVAGGGAKTNFCTFNHNPLVNCSQGFFGPLPCTISSIHGTFAQHVPVVELPSVWLLSLTASRQAALTFAEAPCKLLNGEPKAHLN